MVHHHISQLTRRPYGKSHKTSWRRKEKLKTDLWMAGLVRGCRPKMDESCFAISLKGSLELQWRENVFQWVAGLGSTLIVYFEWKKKKLEVNSSIYLPIYLFIFLYLFWSDSIISQIILVIKRLSILNLTLLSHSKVSLLSLYVRLITRVIESGEAEHYNTISSQPAASGRFNMWYNQGIPWPREHPRPLS